MSGEGERSVRRHRRPAPALRPAAAVETRAQDIEICGLLGVEMILFVLIIGCYVFVCFCTHSNLYTKVRVLNYGVVSSQHHSPPPHYYLIQGYT